MTTSPKQQAACRRDAAALEAEFDAFCDDYIARLNQLIAQCPKRQVRASDLQLNGETA